MSFFHPAEPKSSRPGYYDCLICRLLVLKGQFTTKSSTFSSHLHVCPDVPAQQNPADESWADVTLTLTVF